MNRTTRCSWMTLCLLMLSTTLACGGEGASSGAASALEIDLNGAWEFTLHDLEKDWGWMPATVPGTLFRDQLALKYIPDPFAGRNELVLQGLELMEWRYRKRFDVSKAMLKRKRVELICEGLDTIADVSLNGRWLMRTDNMFRRWTIPVKDALREGENTLEIIFRSPMQELSLMPASRFGPMPATNDRVGGSPFIRKAPYQFGWDWGPRLVSCGVWRPIRLVAEDHPRIDYVTFQQEHDVNPRTGRRAVKATVRVELNAPTASAGALEVELAGVSGSREITIPAGISTHELSVIVADPELWWPNGHGAQRLYELKVVLKPKGAMPEVATKRVGFRTIRLSTARDIDGVSFSFLVNGQPIFCKGANWIPADSFPSRVTERRYRDLLQSAADCHMNMIRVWGGGIYEDDKFYEICDELGLMVWQDFMFACSLYPNDRKFRENVAAEARHNVKRLMSHPSLALWCGNNECETGIKEWYKKESTQWRHYEMLYHELLPEICAEIDPGRDYWPSSPHSVESDNPAKTTDGDCHVWTVWHGSQPFENFETIKARFVSEFGYQAFPDFRTVKYYAQGEELNLTTPEIAHHQKNPGGNTRILTQMLDRFKMPSGFKNFVVLSQIQQGLAIQTAVEHWRRQRPICMGTLYWQLDDCWPVTSWSSIDYFGRWKALQYFARRFYEPLHVSSTGGVGVAPVSIHATYDVAHPSTTTLAWTLQMYSGRKIAQGSEAWLTTGPASLAAAIIPADKFLVSWDRLTPQTPFTPENSYLTFRATNGKFTSRNVHHFARFKALHLPQPKLTVAAKQTTNGAAVTVTSDVFAKWVWLEAEGEKSEGRFSDNFFDLDPGESRTVTYNAPMPQRFVARSLVDTYRED